MRCKPNDENDDQGDLQEVNSIEDFLFKCRVVYLTGDVTERSAVKLIRELEVLGAQSKEPIELRLMTTGGEVDAMFAIIDFIRNMRCKVNVTTLGFAYSAGFFILALCTGKRRMFKNSKIMYHEFQVSTEGSFPHVNDFTEMVTGDGKRLRSMLKKRTKLDDKFFREGRRKDVYLTPKEAKKLGIIDVII